MEILIRCAEHNPKGEGIGRHAAKFQFVSFLTETDLHILQSYLYCGRI